MRLGTALLAAHELNNPLLVNLRPPGQLDTLPSAHSPLLNACTSPALLPTIPCLPCSRR